MDEIDDQKDIASDEEVNNVDAEPNSDPDDLNLTTLDLDDPNSDRNEKYQNQDSSGNQWQKTKRKEEEEP